MERRVANIIRDGVIEETDHSRDHCRVRIDGVNGEWLSPWIARGDEDAGVGSTHRPMKKGQQVRIFSRDGEIGPGTSLVYPGSYRDAFQKEHGLTVDGIAGPKTEAVLATATQRDLGARAHADADDLKAAGSRTVATADVLKKAAEVTTGAALAELKRGYLRMKVWGRTGHATARRLQAHIRDVEATKRRCAGGAPTS